MRPSALTPTELAVALQSLPDWSGDTSGLSRTVTAASFPAAITLVTEVARAAEEADHHPDIDIRWRTLRFFLVTHDAHAVTSADLDLAARIDALAARG